MEFSIVIMLIVAVLMAAIIFFIARHSKYSANKTTDAPSRNPASAANQSIPDSHDESPVAPNQIVVQNGDHQLMTITAIADENSIRHEISKSIQLDKDVVNASSSSLSRLMELLMQVAPASATSIAANNKYLMEVVINGEMIAAKDGNGLRAIAKNTSGKFSEHARLYHPKNLKNVANLAAIWSLASVAVAQKHIADISATLKRVESKIDSIQSLLEEGRLSKIKSYIYYMETAKAELERGKFESRTRNILEQIDLKLDEIRISLIAQIQRECKTDLTVDSIGCSGEYESAKTKYKKITSLIHDLHLCQQTRLSNWVLCSMYPEDGALLFSRLEQIKKTMRESHALTDGIQNATTEDCDKIASKFVRDSTIKTRRDDVRKISREIVSTINELRENSSDSILLIEAIQTEKNNPQRLIVSVENGVPKSIYLRNE